MPRRRVEAEHDDGAPEAAAARTSAVLVVPFVLDGAEHLLIAMPAADAPDELAQLTGAERVVVCAALAGQSNPQIARTRSVSVRTVANQLASAFRKLGVTSRAALASRLSRAG